MFLLLIVDYYIMILGGMALRRLLVEALVSDSWACQIA